MSWALWSGLALTPLVVDSISNWRAPLIDEWSKIHTLLIQRRQNRSMTISAFLQNGCLRQAALKLFERLPGLASPLLKRFEKEHMLADFAHIKKSERITAW
jgi:hypothetical protein